MKTLRRDAYVFEPINTLLSREDFGPLLDALEEFESVEGVTIGTLSRFINWWCDEKTTQEQRDYYFTDAKTIELIFRASLLYRGFLLCWGYIWQKQQASV